MDIGDYTGIPLNEAGRLRAESWHPDQLDLPENLCRPHPIDHGVACLRVAAAHHARSWTPRHGCRLACASTCAWQEPEQVIYLDGRPHPSANAPHKWSGFSTGRWERNTLVYTTTHLKEAYLTRTGVPKSQQGRGDDARPSIRESPDDRLHHQRPGVPDRSRTSANRAGSSIPTR